MRLPLLAASLVLVAGTATACGGGAPTDASAKDFCDAVTNITTTAVEAAGDAPSEDQVKAMKGAFADLEEVGTPDDIPDDAREGFEIVVEAIADVDDDATAEELEKAGDDFSGDDETKTDAFGEYIAETCTDLGSLPEPEMPEMSPSE